MQVDYICPASITLDLMTCHGKHETQTLNSLQCDGFSGDSNILAKQCIASFGDAEGMGVRQHIAFDVGMLIAVPSSCVKG